VPSVTEQFGPATSVWLAGQVIVGGVASFRFTEKIQVVELPAASVAVSVTLWAVLWPLSGLPTAGICDSAGLGEQPSLSRLGA